MKVIISKIKIKAIMKKYLMTSVAALALCAGFTSCSHDDFEPMTQAQIDKAKYDQAFLNYVGGKIASNQDWGFGEEVLGTRAKSDYANYKGTMTPTYSADWQGNVFAFPEDCDASNFLAEVPDGVSQMPLDGEVRGGTYYINSSNTTVNMNTGAGVIYVVGTCDFSASTCFEVTQNTKIYLLEGATLKLSEADANKLKAIIYVAPTAKLETAKRLKMDNTSAVYNHGTIEVGSFEVNNTSILYNVGTLKTTDGIYVANSNSAIVNDGTIISGSAETKAGGDVEVAGSGHVQNNAEWTVYGATIVNSNSASWVNNGHWTTEYYRYTAGSENVINNCFLEVKEDFDINLGSGGGTMGFKIDAGGGVLTKNLNAGKATQGDNVAYSGPYRIIMGSKAVFKVTGTAALASGTLGTWNGGPKYGYGIFGPDEGDYAVFQAEHIVKAGNETDIKVMYGGRLYVSAQDHFATQYDPWNANVVFDYAGVFTKANIFTTNANDEFSTGRPGINIPETPCNPGFIGVEPQGIRIIAEDLSAQEAGDFDFNDIVLDVEYGNSAKLTLQAAGGTLPLRIAGNDAWEVHKLFGVDTNVMVNTTVGNHAEKQPVVWNSDLSIQNAAEANDKLTIEVYKNGAWQTLTAVRGEPAAKLAVDKTFNWLDERSSIKNEYPTFINWVEEGSNGFTSKWWTSAE